MNASYKGVNKGQLCSLTPKINDCHLFHSFFKLNCRCSVWIVEFLLTGIFIRTYSVFDRALGRLSRSQEDE
jgi:hypothetical protein